ncbi:MAG TPA: hypothetical protein VFC00_29940 [Micromonosporaceae bacterium]|nr:hypothetical protein [Micromonosporaceae bacterium]
MNVDTGSKRGRRRLMARAAVVAVAMALATGLASADAQAGTPQPEFKQSAAVRTPPSLMSTHLNYVYWGQWFYGVYTVDIWWGFDYNPANNHLRGWALMSGNSQSIHVQSEPLNLGDRNGVLKSAYVNSQVGYLEVSTDFVLCSKPNGVYRSNLHYSIRWPDGVLTSGQQTGQLELPATTICA